MPSWRVVTAHLIDSWKQGKTSLLFNLKLKVMVIFVLSHQVQKDWTITSVKQVIMNHSTIHIELVKESAGDNGA